MQIFIYEVNVGDVIKSAISILPENEVFANGLKEISIIGFLRNSLLELSSENIQINSHFLTVFHKVVKYTSPKIPNFVESARKQKNGYLYVLDQRDTDYPQNESTNIIGAFEVINGIVAIESYQENTNYQIIGNEGIFQLPNTYIDNLLSEIRSS